MTSESDARGRRTGAGRRETDGISVVVVDDHALMRDGTVQLFERTGDIHVVGESGTAEEGIALIERVLPDVAMVDVNLPGVSGLELARAVHDRLPDIAILVVSAHDDSAYVTEALDIGVDGYLLKTATGAELADAVRAVADGVFVLDRSISRRLVRRWREPARAADDSVLTAREIEVLNLVARGWPNKRVATELGLGVRTVEGHVSRMLAKLGLASRSEAVRYALDHHLVVTAAGESGAV